MSRPLLNSAAVRFLSFSGSKIPLPLHTSHGMRAAQWGVISKLIHALTGKALDEASSQGARRDSQAQAVAAHKADGPESVSCALADFGYERILG
jgi:hypothetical protein